MNWYLAQKSKKLNDFLAPAVWMANLGLAGGVAGLATQQKAPQPTPHAITSPSTPSTQPSKIYKQPSTQPATRPATQPAKSPYAFDIDRLRHHLRFDEGYKRRAYGDPIHDKGITDPSKWKVPTMGIGHAVDLRHNPNFVEPILQKSVGTDYWDVVRGKRDLSDDEISHIFSGDVHKATEGVQSVAQKHGVQFKALPPVLQQVMVNMAFQMGPQGLANFNQTFDAIKAKKWNEVASRLLASKWAKQTPNRAYRQVLELARELGFQPPAPPHGFDANKHNYPT